MKKTISFINNKGGVGKTTGTVNIGCGLSRLGKKVLLVDLDPQANLTACSGLALPLEKNICGALQGTYHLPIAQAPIGVDIVCSTLDLSAAEKELADEPFRELLLKKLLAPVVGDYDWVLIDCPPSIGVLALNALTASELCIIPVELANFALVGMDRLIQLIGKVHDRINSDLDDYKILISRSDIRQTVQKELAESLTEKFGEHVFHSIIRNNVKILESQMSRKDIFSYDPKCNAAQDYMSICEELLKLYES